jgi:hypothetical protein
MDAASTNSIHTHPIEVHPTARCEQDTVEKAQHGDNEAAELLRFGVIVPFNLDFVSRS